MSVTITTDQMLATAPLMLRPLASVHTMAPCHGDHWHWSSVTARADPTLLPHTKHGETHCRLLTREINNSDIDVQCIRLSAKLIIDGYSFKNL